MKKEVDDDKTPRSILILYFIIILFFIGLIWHETTFILEREQIMEKNNAFYSSETGKLAMEIEKNLLNKQLKGAIVSWGEGIEIIFYSEGGGLAFQPTPGRTAFMISKKDLAKEIAENNMKIIFPEDPRYEEFLNYWRYNSGPYIWSSLPPDNDKKE